MSTLSHSRATQFTNAEVTWLVASGLTICTDGWGHRAHCLPNCTGLSDSELREPPHPATENQLLCSCSIGSTRRIFKIPTVVFRASHVSLLGDLYSLT